MNAFRALPLALLSVLLSLHSAFAADANGDRLFKAGDLAGAQIAYRAALAANPDSAAANIAMAQIELYNNRLPSAKALAQNAERIAGHTAQTSRILREVAAREAIVKESATISVPESGMVIPFFYTDPLPLMHMTIDGKAANVLLDTGAPDVAIDPQFAKELHLKVVDTGAVGHFAGNLTRKIQSANIEKLSVGTVTIHHLQAALIPSRNLGMFADRKVDAVVGTIFLARFLSTIDYPKGQLVLRPRTASLTAPDAIAMPFWYVGDHFIFARGSVNSMPEALMLVDSGLAGGGFMPTDATVAAAHVKTMPADSHTGIGGGGPVEFTPLWADRLCLGAACLRDVPGMYTPGASPLTLFPFEVTGAVSHEFLKSYAVTFDFNAMQIILAPGPPRPRQKL
ncbi:MAG: hypothetical protein NVS9B12_06020 [Vulcanimicrobiaceae bacterium]